MKDILERLQDVIGYRFANHDLLMEALTHSTYANEHPDDGPDNERLEFLGDAVLDLVVARTLDVHRGHRTFAITGHGSDYSSSMASAPAAMRTVRSARRRSMVSRGSACS